MRNEQDAMKNNGPIRGPCSPTIVLLEMVKVRNDSVAVAEP